MHAYVCDLSRMQGDFFEIYSGPGLNIVEDLCCWCRFRDLYFWREKEVQWLLKQVT